MRRRSFIWLLGGAAVGSPFPARGQQQAVPVVGFLSIRSRPSSLGRFAAFLRGLREAGFVDGGSVRIADRWADFHYDRLPEFAAELVARHAVVIATTGGPVPALAAKAAGPALPIVFQTATDPVADGLVASFARPGGNLTGVAIQATELTAKRLELLLELVPQATAVGLLVNPNNPREGDRVIREAEEASHTKGIRLVDLKAGSESEIDAVFTSLGESTANALVVGPDPLYSGNAAKLVALAAHHAIPVIYYGRLFAASGGLISYGADVAASWRLLGGYVGKVLKGTKPQDLPVQEPAKFELVINLKTAKALGLTVPPSLLARANEVIE